MESLEYRRGIEEFVNVHACGRFNKMYDKYLRLNRRLIRETSKNLRKACNVGRKRHLETILHNLRAEKLRLKSAAASSAIATGGGFNVQNKRVKWQDVLSAFKGRLRTGSVVNLTHVNLEDFFRDCTKVVLMYLRKAIRKYSCIKVNFVFSGIFVKPNNPDIEDRKYFATENFELMQSTDIRKAFELALDEINDKLSDFNERESGTALKTIVNLAVNINASSVLRNA